jgi:hypothetical protein
VHYFPIKHKPWPQITLLRYHTFTQFKPELDALWLDFVLYIDIDALFMNDVGHEIIPEDLNAIVVVKHPGFYNGLGLGSWEEDPRSQACVPFDASRKLNYYAGGVIGGWYSTFMKMASQIVDWVDADAIRGITAIWHDESHLQKYALDKPKHVLDPGYCFPEGPQWERLPFNKKIMVLEKDHNFMRSES